MFEGLIEFHLSNLVSTAKDPGLSSILPLLKSTFGGEKSPESDTPPEPDALIKALQVAVKKLMGYSQLWN